MILGVFCVIGSYWQNHRSSLFTGSPSQPKTTKFSIKCILFFAEGLGAGAIRPGPGTFGSVVGILWFGLLICFRSMPLFLLGLALSIPLSVWVCGRAEEILKEKDPGSIVMDEIIAIPFCFVSWLAITHFTKGVWLTGDFFLMKWRMIVGVFILFRIFDIAKPWPIRRSQNLPGGWGVTVDDLLAAIYVNAVVLLLWRMKPEWF
jgi:phosphatidylglycerophosphatase A